MDLIQVISQVGFPIAVAAYSLIKLNSTIEENTKVLRAIAVKINVPEEGASDAK